MIPANAGFVGYGTYGRRIKLEIKDNREINREEENKRKKRFRKHIRDT